MVRFVNTAAGLCLIAVCPAAATDLRRDGVAQRDRWSDDHGSIADRSAAAPSTLGDAMSNLTSAKPVLTTATNGVVPNL